MSDELNDLLEEEETPNPDDEDEKNEVDEDGVDEDEEEEERTVPLAALKDERGKRKNLEQQLELYRTQLQMLQNQGHVKKEVDPFDEVDDYDAITKGQLVKSLNSMRGEIQNQIGQLIMSQKYPDYEEVINKYLVPMINADPQLLDTLNAVPEAKRYDFAYRIATTNPNYKKKGSKDVDAETLKKKSKKIIKNSKKAKSPSTVSDGSAGSGNKWSEASEEDILKEALRVVEGG
jgi:hypothetical protein